MATQRKPEAVSAGDDPSELSAAFNRVTTHFQPILWLDDLSSAGYETLARGPEGSPLAQPDALFAAAHRAGWVGKLDGIVTQRSLDAIAAVDWHPSQTNFGNLDPASLDSPPDLVTLNAIERAATDGLRVVVEITERSLTANPGALLRAIAHIRSQGWGIAMDDVGVEEDSLTLLAILRPDVVKLDMSILHRPFDAHAARVSGFARMYCDRTGALMVCEGVETAEHEIRARALGADLVQGFRYGRPAPLPAATGCTHRPVRLSGVGADEDQMLADRLRAVPDAWLPGVHIVGVAAELLKIVVKHTTAALVVVTAPSITDVPAEYLENLAAAVPHAALVALVAPGCDPEPAPGVRGVDASMTDELGNPWSTSVMGPTMAGSILAESLGEDVHDPVRHRIVYDRWTVAHIMRLLLGQMTS